MSLRYTEPELYDALRQSMFGNETPDRWLPEIRDDAPGFIQGTLEEIRGYQACDMADFAKEFNDDELADLLEEVLWEELENYTQYAVIQEYGCDESVQYFEDEDEAVEAAEDAWGHLTAGEKKKQHITVAEVDGTHGVTDSRGCVCGDLQTIVWESTEEGADE